MRGTFGSPPPSRRDYLAKMRARYHSPKEHLLGMSADAQEVLAGAA